MTASELGQLRAQLLNENPGSLLYMRIESQIEELEAYLVEAGPTADECPCGEVDSVWPECDSERRHYVRCWVCGRESQRESSPAEAIMSWNAGRHANQRWRAAQ